MNTARQPISPVRRVAGIAATIAAAGLLAAGPALASTTVPMQGPDCTITQTPIVESAKADLAGGSLTGSCSSLDKTRHDGVAPDAMWHALTVSPDAMWHGTNPHWGRVGGS